MKKRILLVFLCAIMMFTMMGCGPKPEPEPETPPVTQEQTDDFDENL